MRSIKLNGMAEPNCHRQTKKIIEKSNCEIFSLWGRCSRTNRQHLQKKKCILLEQNRDWARPVLHLKKDDALMQKRVNSNKSLAINNTHYLIYRLDNSK